MARRRAPQDALSKSRAKISQVQKELAQAQRQARKEFVHAFSVFRRKGLIAPKYKAREIKPTKYRKRQFKELSGILTGELAAVKAPRNIAKEFKAQGAKVIRQRILVRKRPDEIAAVRRGVFTAGVVTIHRPLTAGYAAERIILPVRYQSLKAFIQGIMEKPDRFDKLKNAVDNFAFQVGGNNTFLPAFTSMAELTLYLEHYEGLLEWAEDNPDEDAVEFLSLSRIMPGYKLGPEDVGTGRKMGLSSAARESQRRRSERLAALGTIQREPRKLGRTAAERMKDYRSRMSEGEREQYRAKARARKPTGGTRSPFMSNKDVQ